MCRHLDKHVDFRPEVLCDAQGGQAKQKWPKWVTLLDCLG